MFISVGQHLLLAACLAIQLYVDASVYWQLEVGSRGWRDYAVSVWGVMGSLHHRLERLRALVMLRLVGRPASVVCSVCCPVAKGQPLLECASSVRCCPLSI